MNKITIYRGDTLSLPVTVNNADGSAFDLTGYTMRFTVKKDREDPDSEAVIPTKTAVITTPATGVGVFTFSTTETNLQVGSYYYDVQISNEVGMTPATIIKTVIVDELVVYNDVTKG